jgi:hypothetical protein
MRQLEIEAMKVRRRAERAQRDLDAWHQYVAEQLSPEAIARYDAERHAKVNQQIKQRAASKSRCPASGRNRQVG